MGHVVGLGPADEDRPGRQRAVDVETVGHPCYLPPDLKVVSGQWSVVSQEEGFLAGHNGARLRSSSVLNTKH